MPKKKPASITASEIATENTECNKDENLLEYIKNIEWFNSEIAAKRSELKAYYNSIPFTYDKMLIKEIVKMRALDAHEYRERELTLAQYKHQLGMLTGVILAQPSLFEV